MAKDLKAIALKMAENARAGVVIERKRLQDILASPMKQSAPPPDECSGIDRA